MKLLHDRYAVHGDCALDMVTGEAAMLAQVERGPEAVDERGIGAIAELLDCGGDGSPRWVVAAAVSAGRAAVGRRLAAAGRRRGFVPMSVSLFRRFGRSLEEDLADRALLLIGGSRSATAEDHAALLAAASVSERPHVLVTFDVSSERGAEWIVREARAAYGPAVPPPRSVPLPPDVRAHLLRASRAAAFTASGRHAAAERLLRDAIGALERRRAHREAAGLALALVELLTQRGRLTAAETSCADAVRLGGLSGDPVVIATARLREAALRIERDRLVQAESIARAVLLGFSAAPIRLRAEVVLAQCLLGQQRIEDAVSLLGDDGAAAEWEPLERAELRDIRVRVQLAAGNIFAAGLIASHAVEGADGGSHDAVLIARMSRLRVLCAAGDIWGARIEWQQVRELASRVRLPMREAEGRCLWVEVLRQAGLAHEARGEGARLLRLAQVATPRLRRLITSVLERQPQVVAVATRATAALQLAPDLVRLAYEEEDDGAAVHRVAQRVALDLGTSRLEVLSADGGPVTTLVGVGPGLVPALGARVMEAGMPLGLTDPASREAAMPIRRGVHLVGALVCRWTLDRTRPSQARAVLELAAAVVGPRLEALQGRRREAAAASLCTPALVGSSAAIEEVRRAILRAARAPFPVLIEGESGTGKELVARAIHQLSPRRERRFCDVNCAALPDELLESELFGHARGAFTGALVDRPGLFEDATGGTLFLDEVADLSARAQAKLLRVVQQQEVRRVGETVSRTIDVRLVAAANRDLQAEADAGRFRTDLLYRLNVIRIRVPPLRERAADVPALAHYFWRDAAARVESRATLTPVVIAHLARYHWPGNVRELQNVIAALAVAAPSSGRVGAGLLPPVMSACAAVAVRLADARDQFERRFVELALAQAGGSRTRAATALGITRQGLLKTMARLQIERRLRDVCAADSGEPAGNLRDEA